MKKTIITALVQLVGVFLGMLSIDKIRAFADWIFDKIEDAVLESSNKIDDVVLLPLITKLREALNIPDNDEAAEPVNTARESEGGEEPA